MTKTDLALDPAFSTLRQLLDAAIEQHLTAALATFQVSGPLVETSFSPAVKTSLNGGKRFRGISAVVGAATWKSCLPDGSRNPADLLLQAATPSNLALGAALEFYQAAALVHDDIVDRAEERRGRPSFHRQLEAAHRENEWLGDGAHFGSASAVLAGDLLLAAAALTLEQAAQGEHGQLVRERFATMTGEVAYGQYLDLQATHAKLGSTSTSNERTLQIVSLKSARYSVAHPVALGALQARGSKAFAQTLEEIFEPAGMAFQLRDDELGVFGDAEQMGKSTSGDLEERKRTVLLGLTYKHASLSGQRQLQRIFSAAEIPSDQEVETSRALFEEYGRAPHELEIAGFKEESALRLQKANLPPSAQQLCSAFIGRLVDRKQ